MSRDFHITLSPIRADFDLHLEREGEILVINGQRIDCTALADGQSIEALGLSCEPLVTDIVAEGAALHLTVLLPHGPDAGEAVLFPAPLVLSEDGPAQLPTEVDPGAEG